MINKGILIMRNCLASIQDNGRKNLRAYGIPVSGFMDQTSARLSNHLLGNDFDYPIIEIFYAGFKCKFNCDQFIAVTGAAKNIKVNGETRSINCVHKIEVGDEIEIKELDSGFISYLSVNGVFGLEKMLGSYSTNVVSGFGGLNGRFLQKGDFIPIKREKSITKNIIQHGYFSNHSASIRILEGPDFSRLSEESKSILFSKTFKIRANSNRMGYRLSGADIYLSEQLDFPSAVTVPGTIQLTSDNQLIVIMKDGQTTGGYPRVGTIIAADLDHFAQKKPGDSVDFEKISYSKSIESFVLYMKSLK